MSDQSKNLEHEFSRDDLSIDSAGNLVFKNVTPEVRAKLEEMLKKDKGKMTPRGGTLKITAFVS
jgi:hypothetical protein